MTIEWDFTHGPKASGRLRIINGVSMYVRPDLHPGAPSDAWACYVEGHKIGSFSGEAHAKLKAEGAAKSLVLKAGAAMMTAAAGQRGSTGAA